MHRSDAPTHRSPARQPTLDDLGTPLIETTFVVLDLETTGLSPDRDRITEVGAVKVRGGEVLGELASLVHPGRPIPAGISAVTGITDAMVRDAPAIGALLPSLLEFLRGGVLVAHNARFDVSFLRAALADHGEEFDPVVVDTARLARRLVREEVRNVRLATLAAHFRARVRPEHRALADARATVDVLHGLLERAGSSGATTLEDLRDLARSSSERAFRKVELVRDAPRRCGTYRFVGPDGEILYVGKATDLRSRLRTYFGQDPRRRTEDLVRATSEVTWTVTPTLLEAEIHELRAIHQHRPRFNRRSKHPERAVHLALTREPVPRLSVVRAPRGSHLHTLGPLPSRRIAERALEALNEATGLRACTMRLRRAQDHPACVLKDLDRCAAPCDGTQTIDEYAAVVDRFVAACEDPTAVLAGIGASMRRLAADGRYERAREQRRRRHLLARVLAGRRDAASLEAVAEIVAVRADAAGTDVVVVRHGRLAGTARLEPDERHALTERGRPGTGTGSAVRAVAPDTRVLDALPLLPLEPHTDPGGDQHAEERRLVLAWLAAPGTRLVRAEGVWSQPVAGGRALSETLAEARWVERQVRRDHQALSGAKVTRHAGDQDSSKNGLNASGGSAREPASRPSQLTRAR